MLIYAVCIETYNFIANRMFFTCIDTQQLVTFREKNNEKKCSIVLVVSKKTIPLHSQSGKQLTID